ncbi:hypothetical protein D3C78_932920 [compost metagenome]
MVLAVVDGLTDRRTPDCCFQAHVDVFGHLRLTRKVTHQRGQCTIAGHVIEAAVLDTVSDVVSARLDAVHHRWIEVEEFPCLVHDPIGTVPQDANGAGVEHPKASFEHLSARST